MQQDESIYLAAICRVGYQVGNYDTSQSLADEVTEKNVQKTAEGGRKEQIEQAF